MKQLTKKQGLHKPGQYWWIQRTTITGNNLIKVNYIWVLYFVDCPHFFLYRGIFLSSQGPFKAFNANIYICVPVLTKTIVAQYQKKLRSDRTKINQIQWDANEWPSIRQSNKTFSFIFLLFVTDRMRCLKKVEGMQWCCTHGEAAHVLFPRWDVFLFVFNFCIIVSLRETKMMNRALCLKG